MLLLPDPARGLCCLVPAPLGGLGSLGELPPLSGGAGEALGVELDLPVLDAVLLFDFGLRGPYGPPL